MHAIGIAGKRLTFDRSDALPAHETYFELAEACMARDPAQRPDFDAMQLVSPVWGPGWLGCDALKPLEGKQALSWCCWRKHTQALACRAAATSALRVKA
jgi:hypothetical protein